MNAGRNYKLTEVVIKFGYMLENLENPAVLGYNKCMLSDNQSGASRKIALGDRVISDNQQERSIIEIIPEDIGWYLAGFTDGEGSFNVSTINRNKDFKHGWKISLSFNISQRDVTVLQLFKDTLQCGSFRQRKDGVTYYEVRRIDELLKTVIPFFEKFVLKSESKRKQFEVFRKITELMAHKEHLTTEGLTKIFALRATIKVARKRKYSLKQIVSTFRYRNPQRLYAESPHQ